MKIERWGKWKIVWINSKEIEKSIQFAQDNNADGVGVSHAHGYLLKDIDFLKEFQDIEGIALPFANDFDLNPLKDLKKLKFITLAETKRSFDFNNFPKLEDLRIQWCNKFTLPSDSTNLKSLYISGYKPASKDLSELSSYQNLEKIEINHGNIESIDGIENQYNIDQVMLYYLKSLTSVSSLSKTNVSHVHLDNCKKIKDIEELSKCKKLKVLRYHDAGEIETLKFLKKFNNLEEFRFVNTTVKDGDMNILTNLQTVAFNNKRHYSHKSSEILKIIKERNS